MPSLFASTAPRSGTVRRGFTIVEMLVAGGVIVALLAILFPTLGFALERARGFECQTSLRSVAFDFSIFANDELHGSRGDDRVRYGRNAFSLETFVESQYGADEFWAFGDADVGVRPDASGVDPMRCSEVRGEVSILRAVPCQQGAVSPTENVSFGFNMRLLWIEYLDHLDRPRAKEVQLTSEVLGQGRTPLVWDVDGRVASQRDVQAIFSAPGLDSEAIYANDQHWFPGFRHAGQMNVAFIDGSVSATREPFEDSSWRWDWQPAP